jgi:hypothetical protein
MYSPLLLSQAAGNDAEDGLLEAWELMNLNLRADLVVLSASIQRAAASACGVSCRQFLR